MTSLRSQKSKWQHPAESLIHRKITYTVKFIGFSEVPGTKGMELVKLALQRLKFSQHMKRTEGTKPPKVELSINISSVIIQDAKNKLTLHRIKLHRISFCADDKKDRRLFAFITKHDDGKHYCYGFDSPRLANEITLTIGQAFELAYEKYIKTSPLSPEISRKRLAEKASIDEMNARIKELEEENKNLRERIRKLELQKPPSDQPQQDNFPVSGQSDAFNMQPFAPPIPNRSGAPLSVNQIPPGSPKLAPNIRMTKDLFDVTASPRTTRKNYVDARDGFNSGLTFGMGEFDLADFDSLQSSTTTA